MNSLKTLYFPGTDIYSIRQYPLFLLFQDIHLLQPVEKDPAAGDQESSDTFIKSKFCQVHTPCPLGEDRERFLHLLSDIRNRKDDYAAQLSSLLLAAQSGQVSDGESSERAIINSLLPPEDLQSKSRDAAREEKLWQARLVLAIGEILDEEEEEIAANLSMLEDDQASLFQALHGDDRQLDDDNPFEELTIFESNLTAASSSNMKKRFNGWKTLYLEAKLEEPEIFLTSSKDSGDLLLESYEKISNKAAPLVLSLELPGLIGLDSNETVEAVNRFAIQNSQLLAQLQNSLKDLASRDIPQAGGAVELDRAAMESVSQEWQELLETDFPEKRYGRVQLNCFLFPAHPCSELLGKDQSTTSEVKNGLLVVMG